MPNTRRGPNDLSSSEERLKKTIRHMEAAEIAKEYAPEKDVAAIEKKNEQRAKSIEELENEVKAAENYGLKGYL